MRAIFLIFLVGLSVPSLAVAQMFDCEITNRGGGGFIGGRMFLALDRDAQSGAALDWAIQEIHKRPMPVTVQAASNPNKWTFRWSVKGVKTANSGTGSVSYTARLNTKTGRVSINGTLAGADNVISGAGQCKEVK